MKANGWPDEADHKERVNRHKVIPIPSPESDQCMRTAFAAVLRVPLEQVPPRRWGQRFVEWIASVTLAHGTYFEFREADELPPTAGVPWVAVIDSDTPATTHAVPCIGSTSGDPRYPRAAIEALCGLVPA